MTVIVSSPFRVLRLFLEHRPTHGPPSQRCLPDSRAIRLRKFLSAGRPGSHRGIEPAESHSLSRRCPGINRQASRTSMKAGASRPHSTAHDEYRSTSNRSDRSVCMRSEEHTSELQSLAYLVCRLLLEKKKKMKTYP